MDGMVDAAPDEGCVRQRAGLLRAWIVLGLMWISNATSLIPGIITITLNGVILVGLAGLASSRAAFRTAPESSRRHLRS
jgi:hypothetical protein